MRLNRKVIAVVFGKMFVPQYVFNIYVLLTHSVPPTHVAPTHSSGTNRGSSVAVFVRSASAQMGEITFTRRCKGCTSHV